MVLSENRGQIGRIGVPKRIISDIPFIPLLLYDFQRTQPPFVELPKSCLGQCLIALAGVAAAEESRVNGQTLKVPRAAILFGAAEALLAWIKVPLTPADREQ